MSSSFLCCRSLPQIWFKPLSSGDVAVNMVNFDAFKSVKITCDGSCIKAIGLSGTVDVRDVWAHKDLGSFQSFSAAVPAGGASTTLIFSQA
eukprot:m.143733 g.143733  ORF g.143733 m.143733 type:complete len:91 (+) comp13212_c0_seq3:1068-1340(+)